MTSTLVEQAERLLAKTRGKTYSQTSLAQDFEYLDEAMQLLPALCAENRALKAQLEEARTPTPNIPAPPDQPGEGYPFGNTLDAMDIQAFFGARDWLQEAVTKAGATVHGAGIGLGQADIDIRIDGMPYNVSIRPLPVKESLMTRDDGGPAFPELEPHYEGKHLAITTTRGMSLRDWFAGMALQGMLAHATRYRPRDGKIGDWHAAIAEEAYELADALLAARGEHR